MVSVGELDAQGHLKIVDRIKNVIKLSQGSAILGATV